MKNKHRLSAGARIQLKAMPGGRPVTGIFAKDGSLVKEIKSIPVPGIVEKVASDPGNRTRTGIFSVFGVKDDVKDIIEQGAFAKTLKERAERFRHLWQHSFDTPPIATIDNIEEIPKSALPSEIIEWSGGTATGGVKVTRTYYTNDLASWVLEALDNKGLSEMSFAFDVVKSWDEKQEDDPYEWWPTRHITELRLWETSDVNWGANPVTAADLSALKAAYEPDLTEKSRAGDNPFGEFAAFFETLKSAAIPVQHLIDNADRIISDLKAGIERAAPDDPGAGNSTPDEGKVDPDPQASTPENGKALTDAEIRVAKARLELTQLMGEF